MILTDISDSVIDTINNPKALIVVNSIGVIATAGFAALGMHYADKRIREENLVGMDAYKTYALYQIGTGVSAAITIAAGLRAGSKYEASIGDLAALYFIERQRTKELEQKNKDLIESAREVVGENKTKKIESAAVEKEMDRTRITPDEIVDTGEGLYIFYDQLTKQTFRSSYEKIQTHMASLANLLIDETEIDVDTYCDYMHLKRVPFGEKMVWNINHQSNPFISGNWRYSVVDKEYNGSEHVACGVIMVDEPETKRSYNAFGDF